MDSLFKEYRRQDREIIDKFPDKTKDALDLG